VLSQASDDAVGYVGQQLNQLAPPDSAPLRLDARVPGCRPASNLSASSPDVYRSTNQKERT